jgi:branched-chain amino acid transport system substrate-binding protein
MVAMANWSGKGHDKLVADFKAKHKEPWMPQDSISTYGDIWIFKEAMEKAGSADPKKVAAAIRSFNESGGAARFFPGGKLSFEPNGRRANSELVIIQWQNGEPKTVYPSSFAATTAVWPKR